VIRVAKILGIKAIIWNVQFRNCSCNISAKSKTIHIIGDAQIEGRAYQE